MLAVAAWIAEIDLSMVDDGIRPVSDVERSVGTDFHIDGAEIDVVCAKQITDFLGRVARALFRYGEAHDPVGAEIAGDHCALPIVRKDRRLDDFQPAELWVAARADTAENLFGVGIGEIHSTRDPPVDPAIAGPIGDKGLPKAVELMSPWIAPTIKDRL